MDIKNLQKEWNAFGEKDPLWSILTEENKKNMAWQRWENRIIVVIGFIITIIVVVIKAGKK